MIKFIKGCIFYSSLLYIAFIFVNGITNIGKYNLKILAQTNPVITEMYSGNLLHSFLARNIHSANAHEQVCSYSDITTLSQEFIHFELSYWYYPALHISKESISECTKINAKTIIVFYKEPVSIQIEGYRLISYISGAEGVIYLYAR